MAFVMIDQTVRHACEGADFFYGRGMAVLFIVPETGYWVVAVPHIAVWDQWDKTHEEPLPLTTHIDVLHQVPLRVDYCPWCAELLPVRENAGEVEVVSRGRGDA